MHPSALRATSVAAAALSYVLLAPGPSMSARTQAPAKRQQPPPPGPDRPLAFPPHTEVMLENGLKVFVVEDHRQPVVSLTLLLPGAGASAHGGDEAGLAMMTAQLLRQGTKTRSAQEISEAIDRVGGTLAGSAGPDAAEVGVTVMTTALDTGLSLLADVVQNPAFAPDEVERWRRQTLSSLQVAYSDPEYIRTAAAQRLAYGTHPYAFPVDGLPGTVARLSRDQVAGFHKKMYSPRGAFLAVAGDITPEGAASLVRKHLGGWTGTAVAIPGGAISEGGRRVLAIDKPDAVQTQFAVVGLGVPRNHPDWLALTVANQVLGGSFNSRLNLRLRAKEGLTYGASSAFSSARTAGFLRASSFTRTEETARAVNLLLDVMREFSANPATPEELREAKAYLSGVFAIQTETAEAVADRVLTSALHGLPADYWTTYRERIRALTAEDIAAAVRKHVSPDKLSIVAVGNASAFAKQLEPLGAVTIVPLARLDLTKPDFTAAPGSNGR